MSSFRDLPRLIPILALAACPAAPKKVDVPPPVTVDRPPPPDAATPTTGGGGTPTVDEAVQFITETDAGLRRVYVQESRAAWINLTYVNHDTDGLAADASVETAEYLTGAIKESVKFSGVQGLPPEVERQLALLRREATLPSPSDPAKREELAQIAVTMSSDYAQHKYCSKNLARWATKGDKSSCLAEGQLKAVLTDPKASWDQLVEAWTGWRELSTDMKDEYARFVELGNEGARELGFDDVGAIWKSRYDMTPAEMEGEVERLWQEVRPLYEQLHCYVRKRLHKKWGDKVPATGPMPAHVFGNMWSQEWGNIYDFVEPHKGQPSIDATKAMKKKGITPRKMAEIAEGFFVSLGMPELPDTFWERSLIEKPRDREVQCHASAWDLTTRGDVRIKMCTEVNEEDLVTLHHELGHNYYYLAYKDEPVLFQGSANDGFHEAVGDTIALSVTPQYLADIGILDKKAAKSNPKADLNLLMRRALDKVGFLPFGMLIDKWRWDVFSGKVTPDRYNEAWWELVKTYQGIVPPAPRGEEFFDPGAKYHVPGNTPYLRYFLARIYQFQFHRALCKEAGHTGPLHTCSIYGNKAAGDKMWKMLELGTSRPWPEAMEALTGSPKADATAILEYFAPLQDWLVEQNQGESCGW
jgi:peptidyl-dipeptidase A